jgi:hypothetical protein
MDSAVSMVTIDADIEHHREESPSRSCAIQINVENGMKLTLLLSVFLRSRCSKQ